MHPAWSADVPATARNGVVHGELRRMDLVSTSHDLDGLQRDSAGAGAGSTARRRMR